MAKKKKLKILWCVDALSKNKSLENHAVEVIEAMGQGSEFYIQPAFVENDIYYKATPLHDKAKKILKSFIERIELKGLKKPKLLSNITSAYSVRDQVGTLLEYAEKSRFHLIVAHTSNRSGLARFFLGSFAETLMLKSKTPLLIINPKSKSHKKIKNIFFPTDLSKESKKGFKKILDLAERMGSSVILYHKLMDPPKILKPKDVTEFTRHHHLKSWVNLGLKHNVKVKIHIEKSSHSISTIIAKKSLSEKTQLIAMVSQSGELETLMVGSSTRQVVREAQLPVWLLHV